MKKEFMEPEMRRIELNLKERIASSYYSGSVMGGIVHTSQTVPDCIAVYMDTTLPASEDPIQVTHDLMNYGTALAGCVPELENVLNSLKI